MDRRGNKPLCAALCGQSKVLRRLTTRCSYFFGSSASAEHTKGRPILGGWVPEELHGVAVRAQDAQQPVGLFWR